MFLLFEISQCYCFQFETERSSTPGIHEFHFIRLDLICKLVLFLLFDFDTEHILFVMIILVVKNLDMTVYKSNDNFSVSKSNSYIVSVNTIIKNCSSISPTVSWRIQCCCARLSRARLIPSPTCCGWCDICCRPRIKKQLNRMALKCFNF